MIWKSNDICFNQAIEEVKINSEVIDNVISDKHAKSFVKNESNRKKVQFLFTKIIVYDIGTFNAIKCVSCANCIYKIK